MPKILGDKGRKLLAIMQTSKRECHQPMCMLAHELVNNLAVIVGHCELLGDPDRPDAERTKHLKAIRDTSKGMAEKLHQHQCHLAAIARTAGLDRDALIE